MSERTQALLKKAFAVHLAGKPEAALASYAAVLRMDPFDFLALQFAGLACCQLERLEEAIGFFRKALRVKPNSGATHIYLGLACADSGRDAEAEGSLRTGLVLEPGNPEAWLRIGIFRLSRFRTAEAMTCLRHALKLKPGYGAALKAIGDVKQAEGEVTQAVESYRAALAADPKDIAARLGLVQTLLSCNRAAESLAECELALAADSRNIQASSNRLFILNYMADLTARQLFEEHRAYGRLFPAPRRRSFANPRDPDRKIRVAFLSQDLRSHAVAFFLEPIVANLDPALFEVILYHDNMRVDSVSERFRSLAALWRNFSARTDNFVESVIRADAPDVLVDVAGHSGQNRLHLYARRLAPVQATYLGYPNTTGLPAMDYRFTDEVADPKGDADKFNVEKLIRFSPCAWAYAPAPDVDAAVAIAPAGQGETVCFGSFNNIAKVNAATLRLWGQVLAAVPGSRLVLKGLWIDPARVQPLLGEAGIDPGRVTMLGHTADSISHLSCYQRIDIALDPFPYGGTTTTCEALWMGRPVVTLAGDRHSSRVGASLLSAIGRPEWIAHCPEEFVRIAAGLAADRSLLRSQSLGLRDVVRASPLLDHHGQARRFGEALRQCWAHWCRADGSPSLNAERRASVGETQPELAHA
jgi:predicted O-linked N-acetylglucosamine transferase (SPINDLY family)